MAGEWIKFECNLPEKPEVMAITTALGWDDTDLTVGKLMRLFRWFDQQTLDGNANSVTPALLDRLIGVTGFVQALVDVGWIVITDTGLSLHNFGKHNGETAKARSLTAKRVANHRSNAPSVTPALAREEKRREEKKEDKKTDSGSAQAQTPPPAYRGEVNGGEIDPKAKVLIDPEWELPESWGVDAENLGWPAKDILREAEKFRQFYTVGKGGGTRRGLKGWRQSWSNWLSNAEKFAPIRRVS